MDLRNFFLPTRVMRSPHKREKLAAQLTWLASRRILGLPEDRGHPHVTPPNRYTAVLLPDGTSVNGRLVDLSLSGAAVAGDTKPAVGALIKVGKTQARVVRMSEDSFAVEFTRPLRADFLKQPAGPDFL